MSVVINPLELQHYWRVMQAGVANDTSLTEYRDELEVLSLHTDNPTLRAMCQKSLTRFDSLGRTNRVANG